MKNVLLVCSENRLRSPAGEKIYGALDDIEATPLTFELLEWADIVFVMERSHRNKLKGILICSKNRVFW